jgi:hypothetical protein
MTVTDLQANSHLSILYLFLQSLPKLNCLYMCLSLKGNILKFITAEASHTLPFHIYPWIARPWIAYSIFIPEEEDHNSPLCIYTSIIHLSVFVLAHKSALFYICPWIAFFILEKEDHNSPLCIYPCRNGYNPPLMHMSPCTLIGFFYIYPLRWQTLIYLSIFIPAASIITQRFYKQCTYNSPFFVISIYSHEKNSPFYIFTESGHTLPFLPMQSI